MKTLKNILLLLCILFLVDSGAASAQNVNFSGTWELDKGKSTLSGRRAESLVSATLVITQKGNNLAINSEQKYGERDRTDEMELKIGGEQVERESMGGRATVKSKAMWSEDTKNLIIVSEMQFGDRGTFTMTETHSLSKDGKTLTVDGKSESSRGTRESKMVYMKK